MPTTYTFRTRVLPSNPYTYNNGYDNYNSSDSGDDNSSNYLILIFLLIVLILVAVFVGGIYKTSFETFEDGSSASTSVSVSASASSKNYTLYYFKMKNCGWCVKFSNGAWADLKNQMSSDKSSYPFTLKEVDINDNPDLAQKYKVTSTPTLIFVDNNDPSKYTIFEGNRNDPKEIATFANKL